MVLQHVAHGAGVVVIVATAFHAHGFTYRDLHLLDMPRAPQRFEQRIAKAQRDEVLHTFLAKVVIGAVDAVFIKRLGHRIVDGNCAGQIFADGLFQHHPGTCARRTMRGQRLTGGAVELRRGAHVIEHITVAKRIHFCRQRGHRRRIIRTGRLVIQALQQTVQGGVIAFGRGNALVDAVGHQPGKTCMVQITARSAQNAHAIGQQAFGLQAIQRRQQHAARQVAGGTKNGQQ